MSAEPRVLFVTYMNNHTRDGLYRALKDQLDVGFLFYSDGSEWYWRGNRMDVDHLGAQYLNGFWLGHTRISPSMLPHLLQDRYDVVIKCINGKFALPATWAAAKMRKKPFVLWTGIWQEPAGLLHRVGSPLLHRIYRSSDAIVTYGRHVSENLAGYGVAPARVFEAPQSIGNERFLSVPDRERISALRTRLGVDQRRVVLYVGRLQEGKGLKTLLSAFATLPSHTALVLVGDGPLANDLRTEAGRLGVSERVRFTGQLGNEEVADCYRLADVFVLPSEPTTSFSEPWGLVVNEAMAAGACVVASDMVGAVRHGLVESGRTGGVFAAGEVGSLAQTVGDLLADDVLRARLADSGKHEILSYTYANQAKEFRRAVDFAVSGATR
jgi:glycosyltransferase involved in cell wall biosynthesis